MRPLYRWIIAIVLAIVLLGIFIPTYYIGFPLGGMLTDSCSNLPPFGLLYLEVLWPIVMLATALIAPVLIIRQTRWRWVWLSLGIGILASIGCYILWLPLLMLTC
jgi:hypothetical protein